MQCSLLSIKLQFLISNFVKGHQNDTSLIILEVRILSTVVWQYEITSDDTIFNGCGCLANQ